LENCTEVIDAWVSHFFAEQLAKINKLNVGLGYWGCIMHEQETIQIRQLRAEFEAQWRRGHRTTSRHVEFPPELQEVQNLASWGSKELIQKIDKWNNLQVFKKLGEINTSW
jgi:hypothetical protein